MYFCLQCIIPFLFICLLFVTSFILHFCERRLEAVWPSYELHLSHLGPQSINAKGNKKSQLKKCDQNSSRLLNVLLDENCWLDSLARFAQSNVKNQHFCRTNYFMPGQFWTHTGKMSAGSIFQFYTPAPPVKM